ncbi:hypothetical protein A3J56_02130 [Candidatus Giovannonibacteria bacterium RIFCSPHIGHO2_02_FULL_46_20]|uniref:Uncharacterized protein n=1 Tax=Candidatus Giovannonibacteria bacterium RIFCSPHIGHO2_02_FULL_46_20 TaxID=1798338 RepID=A0A1F5WDK5_9BACT|nr:MAG: hypothetical protein A3J56_02130 [Candidatus Giovannonibacteria bacterium RIFCSPHIGHO2_02_FULL_46_20]
MEIVLLSIIAGALIVQLANSWLGDEDVIGMLWFYYTGAIIVILISSAIVYGIAWWIVSFMGW